MAMQGRHEKGIAQMRQSLAFAQAFGANIGLSGDLCTLAEAYWKADQSTKR